MRDGQANHTTIFDENRKTPTLRELVLGEDSGKYQASLDSLTFNVILDKLSFMRWPQLIHLQASLQLTGIQSMKMNCELRLMSDC